MDPALIALPATALITGGLVGFLVASIAYDRQARNAPPLAVDHLGTAAFPITGGTDDEGWTEPPRMRLAGESPASTARMLSAIRADMIARQPVEPEIAPPAVMAEHVYLATDAVRHTAKAIAELARFQHSGPHNDRFPLEEDAEVHLAKALQATINILLAYQPSEAERSELGQLEAAIHKFITDYGAA